MQWQVDDPALQSTLFSEFPQNYIDALGQENLALHAHDFVIATDTYAQRPQLADFYNVLATDTHDGTEFVVAIEAKDYPFSGVMFHPET